MWRCQYGKETAKHAMANTGISKTQKASHDEVTNGEMFIPFFDIEFNPQDQRFNQVYYVEILKRLSKAEGRISSVLWFSD
jgi:predicted Holliday junction resolvase-like endonuclease